MGRSNFSRKDSETIIDLERNWICTDIANRALSDVGCYMDEKTFSPKESTNSEDVVAFYDTYADNWDKRFKNTKSTQKFHQVRLGTFLKIAKLKKSEVAIEMGVGTGQYLGKIAPLVKKVVCIDGSQKMLEILLEKNKHLENITVQRMNLENDDQEIEFKSDVIYSFGLIEHIINTNTFIENGKRMLKSSGRIIFITPNRKCPWYGKLRRFFRSGKHCSTDRYYSKDQLDSVMYRHGFIPQNFLYWGYYPAGVGNLLYNVLNVVGKILDKTRIQQYAGGLTISYVLKKESLDGYS